MFGRRRRAPEAEPDPAAAANTAPAVGDEQTGDAEATTLDRPDGPFDIDELGPDQARQGRVDLGGLLVPAGPGRKLQLQINEQTGKASSVMVVTGDAAVQLIAVAAPRTGGLWEQTRIQVMADAKKRSGSAEEATGPFGSEVRVLVPVTTPDGKKGVQPSRITGIDGPRWMLRATFLGGGTSNAQTFAELVEIVKDVVVVRGDRPMPPGDVIPLTPPQASPNTATESTGDASDVG